MRLFLSCALILSVEAQAPLSPPPGQTVILSLIGKGRQIYVCQKESETYHWKLKAPAATLFDEKGGLVGRHFAGPTWELNDGSRVTGKMAVSVPAPVTDAIPWLSLEITSNDEKGSLAGAKTIQRTKTKGGVAPAGGCDAAHLNEELPVAYEASYLFYARTVQNGAH